MTDIVINPKTTSRLDALKSNLPHGVLLSGAPGVGLATIAKHLAARNLAAFIEPLDSKGRVDHEIGTISVEVIRTLYDQTRSKSLERCVFVIDDADRMSAGASAAFLKLLEEPTSNTYFILTSHAPQRLLPTIRSRLQTTTIELITPAQTKEFINELKMSDQTTKVQLEYLALGLPAELARLTASDDYFKQRAETMSDTRTLLSGTLYQKILTIQKYHSDRSKAIKLIDSALIVSKRSLHTKPQHSLVEQLASLLSIREKISANGNIRLQLLAFVVQ